MSIVPVLIMKRKRLIKVFRKNEVTCAEKAASLEENTKLGTNYAQNRYFFRCCVFNAKRKTCKD